MAGAVGASGPKGDTGAAGSAGAQGAAGAQGPVGPTGPVGATGPAGAAATISVGSVAALAPGSAPTVANTGTSSAAILAFGIPTGEIVTPSAPTRMLGTAFQISPTKAALACYSVALSVTNPLLVGSSTAQVQLLSDAAASPTTVRETATAGSAVGVTVSLQLTTSNAIPLCYLVPAGHYVKLVSSTTGTASVSIVSQTEEVLG